MPTYTRILMNELAAQGWTVDLRPQGEDSCVAVGKKDGHTCVGESDGDLGALLALKRSIRQLMPKQPPGEATISSANGNDFAQAVFAFGYDQYIEAGRGIVVMREGDLTRNEDASIDARLTYLAADAHDDQIPDEARNDLMDYDPEKEAVFVTLAGDGSAMVMRVGA